MLFGLSPEKIRLWVPSATQYYRTGYTININKGWGGPSKGESRRDAQVRVVLRSSRPPDFDSGWFTMKSNDPNLSYKQIAHTLTGDMTYAQVRVTYRSTKTGSVHEAFQFQGTGTQQSDASGGQYGGLLYAWSQNYVRIWAPNYAGSKRRLNFDTIILKNNCVRHSFYCHELNVGVCTGSNICTAINAGTNKFNAATTATAATCTGTNTVPGGSTPCTWTVSDPNRKTVIVRTKSSENLKIGDLVVFKDTMFLDGEVQVEHVIDLNIFMVSVDTNVVQSSITRRHQTITTNASKVNEIQVLRLYNGDTFTQTGTAKKEVQHFICDASGGTFQFQLANDGIGSVTSGVETTAAIQFNDNLATVKSKLEALESITTVTVEFDTTTSEMDPDQTVDDIICLPRKGHGKAPVPIKITFVETKGRNGDIHELKVVNDNLIAQGNEIQTIKTIGGSTSTEVEVQRLSCKANTGNFALSFTTFSPVPSSTYTTTFFNSKTTTKSQVITALNNLPSINSVSLKSGETGTDLICNGASSVTTLIQMDNIKNYAGNVPDLVVVDDATTPFGNNPIQVFTTRSTYGGTPRIEKQVIYCDATSGNIILHFSGELVGSYNIGINDDLTKVESDLKALSLNKITDVSVVGTFPDTGDTSLRLCGGTGLTGAAKTTITFTSGYTPSGTFDANVPDLVALSSSTFAGGGSLGSSSSCISASLCICISGFQSAASPCVGDSIEGAGPLGGTFELTGPVAVSGASKVPAVMSYNENENNFESKLASALGLIKSDLNVIRTVDDATKQTYSWTVTFLPGLNNGANPLVGQTPIDFDLTLMTGVNNPRSGDGTTDDGSGNCVKNGQTVPCVSATITHQVSGSASVQTAVSTPGLSPIVGAFLLQVTKADGTKVNTTAISVDADAPTLKTALQAVDTTLSDTNIEITTTTADARNQKTWKIEFIGALANKEQPDIVAIGHPEECQLDETCEIRGNNADIIVCKDGIATTGCTTADSFHGNTKSHDIQEITQGISGLGGTFTVTYKSQTTSPIAVDVTLNFDVVKAAIESLSTVGVVTVTRLGNPLAWKITFESSSNGGNIDAMTVDFTKIEGTAHYARVCTDNQDSPADDISYTRAGVTYTAVCGGASVAGNSLGGTFQLTLLGSSSPTPAMNHDVSAAEMQTNIRNLGITSATVTREKLEDLNGDGICDTPLDSDGLPYKEDCEEGSCGCQGDQQDGYRWYVDLGDDNEQRSLGYISSLSGSTHKNAWPTIEIASRYLGVDNDKCPKPTPSISCNLGTVVRFPDALDCGLGKVACFLLEEADTTTCCADPSFRNSTNGAQAWGVCPNPEFLGECVDYPLRTSLKEGKIMNMPIGKGWGGPDSHYEFEDNADVRVQIWNPSDITPAYDSGWRAMSSYGDAFNTFSMFGGTRNEPPERVQVIVKGHGNMEGFYFPAAGASSGSDERKFKEYGGILYRYSNHYCQVYAPGVSANHIAHLYGSIVQVGDGWGNGEYNYEYNALEVKVSAWMFDELTERDTAYVHVNITDANEPPNPKYMSSRMYENDPVGAKVGVMPAVDQDPHGLLMYNLTSNLFNAFSINQDGTVYVANSSALDFEISPFFALEVTVTDGRGISVVAGASVTLVDENDLPRFCESECMPIIGCLPARPEQHQPLSTFLHRDMPEFSRRGDNAEKGKYQGGNICAQDDDEFTSFQTVSYALDESTNMGKGSDGTEHSGVFKVGFCDGKITLMKGGALDYEGVTAPSHYDLLISISDDGPVGRSGKKENASAILRINAENQNDPPTWPRDGLILYVNESIDIELDISGNLVGLPIKEALWDSLNHVLDVDIGDTHFYTLQSISLISELNPGTATGKEFSLNNLTGQVAVGEGFQPDFEKQIYYDINVLVRDSDMLDPPFRTVSGGVKIKVRDQNDAPAFILNEENDENDGPCKKGTLCRTVPESAGIHFNLTKQGGPLIANDEDIEDKFEFSVTGGDIDLFGIITNEVGGVIQVLQNNKLDFEGGNLEYTIDIMLSDLGILVEKECRRTNPGQLSSAEQKLVTTPILYADLTTDQQAYATGTYVFCEDCGENGDSSCSCTAQGGGDAVVQTQNNICVWLGGVIDNVRAPPNKVLRTVRIVVTNVNEVPVLDFNGVSSNVPENSQDGTPLGVVVAIDPDNAVVADLQKLSYYMAQGPDSPKVRSDLTTLKSCHSEVCVHRDTGVLTVNGNGPLINFEQNTAGTFDFFIRAEDNGGNCLGLREENCHVIKKHTVTILNANDAPVFPSQPILKIDENSIKGSSIGSYLADDEDGSDQLTYIVYENLITGKISDIVEVDPSTLNLIVKNSLMLNYEERTFIQVFLSTNDNSVISPGAFTANISVMITIVDVNEPPRWPTETQFSAPCDAIIGARIGTLLSNFVVDDRCLYSTTGCVENPELIFKMISSTTDKLNVTDAGKIYVLSSPLDAGCGPEVIVSSQTLVVEVKNRVGVKMTQNVVIQPQSGISPPYFFSNSTHGVITVELPENADTSVLASCNKPFCPNFYAVDQDTGSTLIYSL